MSLLPRVKLIPYKFHAKTVYFIFHKGITGNSEEPFQQTAIAVYTPYTLIILNIGVITLIWTSLKAKHTIYEELMGTETIVTFIIAGLLIFVGTAFVIHTVEQNRREKKRLETSLYKRAANLQHMLDNFPENFLGNDLKALICKSLLNIYEQLINIGSSKTQCNAKVTDINQHLQTLAAENSNKPYQALENAGQIKEVKDQLNMLYGFINQLSAQNSISKAQAESYTCQLKVLLSQTAIDNYVIAARQAEAQEKFRLAIHYYQAALDKLEKENLSGAYHQHALDYQKRIADLRPLNDQQQVVSPDDKNKEADTASNAEWDNFMDTNEDEWKKKSVYD